MDPLLQREVELATQGRVRSFFRGIRLLMDAPRRKYLYYRALKGSESALITLFEKTATVPITEEYRNYFETLKKIVRTIDDNDYNKLMNLYSRYTINASAHEKSFRLLKTMVQLANHRGVILEDDSYIYYNNPEILNTMTVFVLDQRSNLATRKYAVNMLRVASVRCYDRAIRSELRELIYLIGNRDFDPIKDHVNSKGIY